MMNSTQFGIYATGGLIVSATMGALHQTWWLVVLPFLFGTYFFGCILRSDAIRARYGAPPSFKAMLIPNTLITGWNTAVQATAFLVGWLASVWVSSL